MNLGNCYENESDLSIIPQYDPLLIKEESDIIQPCKQYNPPDEYNPFDDPTEYEDNSQTNSLENADDDGGECDFYVDLLPPANAEEPELPASKKRTKKYENSIKSKVRKEKKKHKKKVKEKSEKEPRKRSKNTIKIKNEKEDVIHRNEIKEELQIRHPDNLPYYSNSRSNNSHNQLCYANNQSNLSNNQLHETKPQLQLQQVRKPQLILPPDRMKITPKVPQESINYIIHSAPNLLLTMPVLNHQVTCGGNNEFKPQLKLPEEKLHVPTCVPRYRVRNPENSKCPEKKVKDESYVTIDVTEVADVSEDEMKKHQKRERDRKYRANLSLEKVQANRDACTQRYRERRALETPEERERRRLIRKELAQLRREKIKMTESPEERERRRQYYREKNRKNRQNMSEEQKAKVRAANTKRMQNLNDEQMRRRKESLARSNEKQRQRRREMKIQKLIAKGLNPADNLDMLDSSSNSNNCY